MLKNSAQRRIRIPFQKISKKDQLSKTVPVPASGSISEEEEDGEIDGMASTVAQYGGMDTVSVMENTQEYKSEESEGTMLVRLEEIE
jgi:hypothetical protein